MAKNIKVRAVSTTLRNPYTNTLFTPHTVTDVNDLGSDDNYWTRRQLQAGVLEEVKPAPPAKKEVTQAKSNG